MGMPVVKVAAGGLPVTIATNGYGTPCTEATNGIGVAVTQSAISGGGLAVTGFTFGPTIQLSTRSVLETAAVNTTIGTLSVSAGTTGSPVFTLVSGGSTFNILGTALRTSVLLDYETVSSYSITVAVSGVSPTVSNATFAIIVLDVAGPAAPVLVLTSDVTDLTPDLTLTGDLVLADVVRFQYSTSAVFSGASELTNTIDAGEDAANTISFTTGSLATGTWYFRARIERGTEFSNWSNTETITLVGPSYTGPGDIVSGAVGWWGLRAYNAAYATGSNPAIDIQDQAGANPLTVNITSAGLLDYAAINAWVTAHSVSGIRVTKLYDQTGGSIGHLVYAGGFESVRLNLSAAGLGSGKAAWNHSVVGVAHGRFVSTVNVTRAQPFSTSAVLSCDEDANWYYMGTDDTYPFHAWGSVNDAFVGSGGSGTLVGSVTTISTFHAVQIVFNGGSSSIQTDATNATSSTTGGFAGGFKFWVGGHSFQDSENRFRICEIGLWPSAFDATQKNSLNANQHTAWGF